MVLTPSTTTTLQNYVGGRWTDATATETQEVRNPATDELLAHVPLSGAADVDGPAGLDEAAGQAQASVQRLVPDPGGHQPAVDQKFRGRDEKVHLGPFAVHPRPQGLHIGGSLQRAEHLARRGDDVHAGDRGEGQERVPGDRAAVQRKERDPHFTAPRTMPRRK